MVRCLFLMQNKQTKKVCILKVNFCKCLGWIGAYCVGISTPEWCHLYFGVWGAFWVTGSSGIKPSADAQKPLFSLHCLILKKIKRCGYKPDICRKPTDKVKYMQRELLKKTILKILSVSSKIFRDILHPYKNAFIKKKVPDALKKEHIRE